MADELMTYLGIATEVEQRKYIDSESNTYIVKLYVINDHEKLRITIQQFDSEGNVLGFVDTREFKSLKTKWKLISVTTVN
jgi:hypothetical protein